jgi:hypothetical protein
MTPIPEELRRVSMRTITGLTLSAAPRVSNTVRRTSVDRTPDHRTISAGGGADEHDADDLQRKKKDSNSSDEVVVVNL